MKPKDSQEPERNNIQVIARAASIFRVLQRNPNGLSLGEIAKAVDLPRSTVQRIVDALDHECLVIASAGGSGVRLGPALIALAAATRFQLADIARATLEALARSTGEPVALVVADHDKVVQIDQIAGTHTLTAMNPVGKPFPLHSSAAGKAILACYSDVQIAKLKKRLKLTKYTKNTITSWDALECEIAKIRETGIAHNYEENMLGICAIAYALRSPTGEIAAIAITVPSQRFNEPKTKVDLTKALLTHCKALSSKLTV